jgi:hypothetical protein
MLKMTSRAFAGSLNLRFSAYAEFSPINSMPLMHCMPVIDRRSSGVNRASDSS